MKAEEKAKELFERFEFQVRNADGDISHTKEESKQCAMIAVDEIINDYENCSHDIIPHKYFEKAMDFWKEVKSEIIEL